MVEFDRCIGRQVIHAAHQRFQIIGHDKICALFLKRLHRRRRSLAQTRAQYLAPTAIRQVRILFRSRQRELLFDDLLRKDESAMLTYTQDAFERAQRVKTGHERRFHAVALGIKPHRRRNGQHANTVIGPDRSKFCKPSQ